MSEWLLTNEQLWEAYGEGKCEGDIRGVAEAQAKKVGKWLAQEMDTAPYGIRLARFEKCLQTLKEQ